MATDLERLVVSLEANIKKFEREMARSRQTTDSAMRGVERRTEQATRRIENMMASAGRRINAAIGGMLAGLSVQQVAQFADAYTKVQNALKTAGLEGQELASTYRELFAISQRQGAPLEAMAQLYSRLGQSQTELNTSTQEMLRFTEGVALALRVQGTDAQAASGALMQLGQALAGGVVRAEEFNSINEAATPILKAVAAGMVEAGGSVAKLRTLVNDGKVSSEAFYRAFDAGRGILDDMAKNTVPTLGQGMTRVYNALSDAVGKMNEAVGATEGFQSAINGLIEDVGKIPAGLQTTIHELERFIQLFGEAKAYARSGLAAVGIVDPRNRIDEAFDANSYAVHGSMRGYKPPANATRQSGSGLPSMVGLPSPISLANFPVSPGSGSGGGGRGSGGGKSSQERVNELQRETQAIQARTRALDVERQTIGLSAGETAKAEAAFRLLEAAKEANVAVTPELKAQIDSLAAAYGEATQKIEDAQEAQEAVADAAREFGQTLSGAFSDAILEGEKLDEIGRRLAKTFGSRALDSLFGALFGGNGGSGGGLLDGLFRSFIPGKAGGGMVNAMQPYEVGENGRELFVPTTPGRIVPHGKYGGGAMQVVINNNAGAQVSTRQVPGPQGPRLEVQIEQMLGGMVASGGLDKALKQRFGVSPMGGR